MHVCLIYSILFNMVCVATGESGLGEGTRGIGLARVQQRLSDEYLSFELHPSVG